MDTVTCPKCSHQQEGGVECESCGVIFARYEKILQRKAEAALEAEQKANSSTKSSLPYIAIISLLLVAVGYLYFKPSPQNMTEIESADPLVATTTQQVPTPITQSTTQRNIPQKASLQRSVVTASRVFS